MTFNHPPWQLISLLLGISLGSPYSLAKTITTLTLTQATIEALPHCLHYQTKGLCYWWVPDGLFGHPEATLKVAHYLPDVVVSVFDRVGDDPWMEANTVYDQPAYSVARSLIKKTTGLPLGGGRHSLINAHDTAVQFKEVTIVGNPGIHAVYHACALLNKAIIPSQSTAFMLYFSSLLDAAAWRLGAASFNPSNWVRATPTWIGTTRQPWGALYPRDGFIVAANDGVAGAIAAQRAADIITKFHQLPHIYHRLSVRCGSHCDSADVRVNAGAIRWQRVYPHPSTHCVVFGKASIDSMAQLATHTQGAYVWLLWRKYEGCIPPRHGGKYLGES